MSELAVNLGFWHGASLAGLIFAGQVVFNLGMIVGAKRKELGVPLPAAYADEARVKVDPKAHTFNCYQRAHSNLLEGFPMFVLQQLVATTRYPVLTTATTAMWVLGAILYWIGYTSTAVPDKRYSRGGVLYRIAPFFSLIASIGAVAAIMGYPLF